MKRSFRHKLAAGAAVALLVIGGAIAAVSAIGEGSPHRGVHARARGIARARDLAAASSYLGVPVGQLEAQLARGRSLAQVADATAGKSAAGLTAALLAEKRQRLDRLANHLSQRVQAEVNRAGGPGALATGARPGGGRALFAGRRSVGFVAAAYLGIRATQLQSELRAGRTLAQVASATAGKSPAGLVDAIVAARRERLLAAAAAGRLSKARVESLGPKLAARVTALVNRKLPNAGLRASKR
jgi:hypothetical protein